MSDKDKKTEENKENEDIIWIKEELEKTIEMEIDDMREKFGLQTIHR